MLSRSDSLNMSTERSKPQNKKYFISFSESTLENSCVYL